MTGDRLVTMRGIVKSFGPFRALDGVDFDLHAGEVHVLAGENGAGKSTLVRVLGGVLEPDEGTVEVFGRGVRLSSAQDAARAGIAVIHQELSLAASLNVEDNIVLAREPAWFAGVLGAFAPVDRRARRRQAEEALERVGLDVSPARRVGSLSLAQRQLVEIAKALSRRARIIVMDEPTSALPAPDADRLFRLIADLRRGPHGAGIVFITHRMEEIERMADRITVLRDGRRVTTAAAADLPREELVRAMVGRDAAAQITAPRAAPHGSPEVLTISGLRVRTGTALVLDDVDLGVRAGDILGLAGLQGSGVSTLLRTLFGDVPAGSVMSAGAIRVEGRAYEPMSPRDAIARGFALVTSDRRGGGLCLNLSVRENLALPSQASGAWLAPVRRRRERADSDASVRELGIRCRSPGQPVRALSGGNQQKVVLGKWLPLRPIAYLLDDPTRGVDVGSKQEIHALIRGWAVGGAAVVLTSSELPELLELSDHVVVLHRGRVAGRFPRGRATPERIVAAALGVSGAAA